MSVAGDILASWLRPRRVIRRLLDAGPREDRAFGFLILGCGFVFLSQVPRIVRADTLETGTPFGAQIGGAILAWLFIVPLVFYAIAGVSHLAARLFGGAGNWYGARLALFWALLAASPAWLITGLVYGFFGAAHLGVQAISLIALALFFAIWLAGMVEAEKGPVRS